MLCLFCVAALSAEPLKIATFFPDNSRAMQQLKSGAKEIERQTAGRVAFKFYVGGVMGSDLEALDKMDKGQLNGAIVSGGSLNIYNKDMLLYHLPLKYKDENEIQRVRQTLDPKLIHGLAEAGLETLGIADRGIREGILRSLMTRDGYVL